MSRLLITLIILVLSCSVSAGESMATRLAGQWRGVGVQSDDQNWLMELTLTGGGATVDYPDMPCGGTWVFSKVQSDSITATEIISYGRDLCIDNSTVILSTAGEGNLLALWKNPDDSDLAIAVLYREGPRPHAFKTDFSESMRAWNNR